MSKIPSFPLSLVVWPCPGVLHSTAKHPTILLQSTDLLAHCCVFFFNKKHCSYHSCYWLNNSTAVFCSVYYCDPYISCNCLFLLWVPLFNTLLVFSSYSSFSPFGPHFTSFTTTVLGMCTSLTQMTCTTAKNVPDKLLEPSACSRAKRMTYNLIVVFLNILPFPSALAVLRTSVWGSCSLGVVLSLCLGYKSLSTMQITRSHQINSHKTNGALRGCTDCSSWQFWGFAILSIIC